MEGCGKERWVALAIGIPRKVRDLGIDEMMRGNVLKPRPTLLVFDEFEDRYISSIGHYSEVGTSREKMKIKYGRLICQLLHECPRIVRVI